MLYHTLKSMIKMKQYISSPIIALIGITGVEIIPNTLQIESEQIEQIVTILVQIIIGIGALVSMYKKSKNNNN